MTLHESLVLALAKSNVHRTNTPLEVLARHMIDSLFLFEESLLERSKHPFYSPGKVDEETPSVVSTAVPRYIHTDDDEPIPGLSRPEYE